MKGGLVLGVSSRALLGACERLGVDTAPALAAVGLERAVLDDPDARIPGETVAALWREVMARSPDPDLALRAAEHLPFGAYAVIDFLARSARTIGEAMTRVARYFPLINSVVELPIEVGVDRVRYGIVDPRDPAALPRPYVEYALAAVYLRIRGAVGVPFRLISLELAFPAPADTTAHVRVFGCPVHFGAPRSEMVIARSAWDTPVAHGDDGLGAVLERHADMLLAELPRVSDAVGQVRAAIHRELAGGEPTLARIARTLGTSTRVLQRRLAGEGVQFGDLLDDARSAVARSHLARRELSIAEISHLLGFAEQSSFTRAFRRWTGSSPAAYRAEGAKQSGGGGGGGPRPEAPGRGAERSGAPRRSDTRPPR